MAQHAVRAATFCCRAGTGARRGSATFRAGDGGRAWGPNGRGRDRLAGAPALPPSSPPGQTMVSRGFPPAKPRVPGVSPGESPSFSASSPGETRASPGFLLGPPPAKPRLPDGPSRRGPGRRARISGSRKFGAEFLAAGNFGAAMASEKAGTMPERSPRDARGEGLAARRAGTPRASPGIRRVGKMAEGASEGPPSPPGRSRPGLGGSHRPSHSSLPPKPGAAARPGGPG